MFTCSISMGDWKLQLGTYCNLTCKEKAAEIWRIVYYTRGGWETLHRNFVHIWLRNVTFFPALILSSGDAPDIRSSLMSGISIRITRRPLKNGIRRNHRIWMPNIRSADPAFLVIRPDTEYDFRIPDIRKWPDIRQNMPHSLNWKILHYYEEKRLWENCKCI